MSNPLLIVLAIINAGIAIGYLRDNNPGMALAFTCYAIASFGFLWTNLR